MGGGGAAGDDRGGFGLGGERRHQRGRVVRGGQDVDIANGLPPAPQRARISAALAAGHGGQRRHHGRRRVHGHVEQHPLAALPVHLDAASQPLLAAGPEPGQPFQLARLDRRGQFVHRRHAQVVVELQGPLGSQAGHPGQLEDAGRYLGPQLVQRGDVPGGQVLGDLGRDRGADAGDGPQALGVEPADVIGPAADRTGRLLVVSGPEHVAPGDLGQLGVLPQQARDLLVRSAIVPPPAPSQPPLRVAGQGVAAVVGHHVAQGAGQVHRGAALRPGQLEVGAMQVTHDPFGIKKVLELPQVSGPCGLQR